MMMNEKCTNPTDPMRPFFFHRKVAYHVAPCRCAVSTSIVSCVLRGTNGQDSTES